MGSKGSKGSKCRLKLNRDTHTSEKWVAKVVSTNSD